ncbi:hypothetical protein GGX14DRAFT_401690 [Mycena pura]|uniref:Uncharacterized protein n=1 Tax=Mycena pura TaxID=153505 RepID=A0AAD6UZW9_9AGAR|nr:hypothetical protein GGX14DRAFT_401690 [Mycena pura]
MATVSITIKFEKSSKRDGHAPIHGGPEFLTQATPERLGKRIERAAEGKHSQGIRMDRRQLQSVKMLNIVMKIGELDSDDQIEVGEMTQEIMRNGGKKAVGSMWEKQCENAELREASWCLDNANEEESAEDIEEEDRDVWTSSKNTAQDAGDAQKIAKGRESTIGSDQGHRVEREVEGHLQETQRKTGKLQIGWMAAITQRKGAGPITCQKYKAGWRRAGGLGVNHELRSAASPQTRDWTHQTHIAKVDISASTSPLSDKQPPMTEEGLQAPEHAYTLWLPVTFSAPVVRTVIGQELDHWLKILLIRHFREYSHMNGYYHLRGPALKPGAAGWTQDTNELVIHYLSEYFNLAMLCRPLPRAYSISIGSLGMSLRCAGAAERLLSVKSVKIN